MEGIIGKFSTALVIRKYESCEDSSVEYAQFDNVRFIFRDGGYVGWYAC